MQRFKIIVDFKSKEYEQITNEILLIFINYFRENVSFTFKDILFRISFDEKMLGILIYLNEKTMNIEKVYETLKLYSNELIFAYSYQNNTIYLSENKYFIEDDWKCCIDSFSQVSKFSNENVHSFVNHLISSSKSKSFLGLGGESYYYAVKNRYCFSCCTAITNSKNIHDNWIINKYNDIDELILTSYEILNIKKYIKDNTFLIVNISKKGLKDLVYDIINVKEIIYIGCCNKYVEKDLKVLKENYIITDYKIFSDGSNEIYILKLVRI